MSNFENFLRKIYLSPLARFVSLIQNFLSFFHKPFMVYGYKNKVIQKFQKHTRISSSAILMSRENINIDDHVWVWHYTIIDGTAGVKIGKGCHIGGYVGIFSHGSHNSLRYMGTEYIYTPYQERKGYIFGPIFIGEFSFVGAGSKILPGVNIGKNCIVASNAVVSSDVEDFQIVGGIPAKVIGDTRDVDKKFLESIKK